jgi:hypothetical protein
MSLSTSALKDVVAELTLENRLLKKARSGWGGRRMRYPVAKKSGDLSAGRAIPAAGAPHLSETRHSPRLLPLVRPVQR